MANIPVERKGGAAWLPWLLGILSLIALVWLGAELFDQEPDADEVAGIENNEGPIDDVEIDAPEIDLIDTEEDLYEPIGAGAYVVATELDDLEADGVDTVEGVDTEEEGEIVGMAAGGSAGDTRLDRPVDLDDARVLSVVGDSAFFVGTDDNRRVLVVLESLGESQTGADGTDGTYNINEGDRVSIDGTVARYTEGTRGTWELSDADRERMLRQGLYVRVNSDADISIGG